MTNRTMKRRFEIDAEHLPDLPGMMLVTVEALRDLGGSATIQELDEKVIELEEVTEAEQSFTMRDNANLPRVNYYLAWARTNLKRGNALANPSRGIWELTESGSVITTRAQTDAMWEQVIQDLNEQTRVKEQTSKVLNEADDDSVEERLEGTEDWTSTAWYRERFGTADVWTIAPGEGARFWGEFLEFGIAAIGWDHLGDLSDYASREDIHSALIESGAGQNPYNQSLAAWEFVHEIKIGDIVLAKKGRRVILGWGKVTGDYTYLPERAEYQSVRTVDWHPCRSPINLKDQITTKTLTRFTAYEDWLRFVFDLIDADVEDADLRPSSVEPESFNIATALGDLFLEETQFQRILDSIALRKNLILQGPPGVGKTFIARRIAWCLLRREDSRFIEMVQFHQSYAYEDFVQGWRPTDTGGFTLRNGVFFEFCKRAEHQPEKNFVFIIDEINRGNLSKIFGELLMLIEADKRGPKHAIALTYSNTGERFSVPDNVHILGLMNTADRSLAIVDYALRRRFAFETLLPAYGTGKFRDYLRKADVDQVLVDRVNRNLTELNKRIRDDKDLGPGFQIGHSYFMPEEAADDEWYLGIVDTQVEPLLREYWFDRPEQVDELVEKLRQ